MLNPKVAFFAQVVKAAGTTTAFRVPVRRVIGKRR